MKKYIAIAGLIVALNGTIACAQDNNELFLADPTIYSLAGKYYLAGTQGGRPDLPYTNQLI